MVHLHSLSPSPTHLRTLCASAICSFWKISGGRNGDSFPPSSEKTLRCLEMGAGPPAVLGLPLFFPVRDDTAPSAH